MFKCVKGEHNLVFNNGLFVFLPNIESRATQEKECESYPCYLVPIKLNGFNKEIIHNGLFYLPFSHRKISILPF